MLATVAGPLNPKEGSEAGTDEWDARAVCGGGTGDGADPSETADRAPDAPRAGPREGGVRAAAEAPPDGERAPEAGRVAYPLTPA